MLDQNNKNIWAAISKKKRLSALEDEDRKY